MLRNVILLNDYASVQGGAAQVAVSSALGLAKSGFSVYYVYAVGEPERALSESGVKCICLDQFDLLGNPSKLGAALDGVWNFEVERRVSSILRQFSSDDTVVHLHSWVKGLSISAFLAVQKSGLKYVVTLHDYFSACPNGGFYNYKAGLICDKKAMTLGCITSNCDSRGYSHKLWRAVRQFAYGFPRFPRVVKNFITVSNFSEQVLKPYLSSDSVFWRIPNPIETVRMPAAKPAKASKFTFIGRLSPEKGVLIISKLKNLCDSQLRFIGAGELEPLLRQLFPNASFEGWRDRNDILNLLEDTRALLFTSNLYETQGLVVLEAASRGVPAIVSDCTAASEFIRDGVSGVLYETGNPYSLDQALLKLKDDRFVERLGDNAYSLFWENPPTLEAHVHGLVSCYTSILQRPNA